MKRLMVVTLGLAAAACQEVAQTCSNDGDCQVGQVCASGVCVIPSSGGGTAGGRTAGGTAGSSGGTGGGMAGGTSGGMAGGAAGGMTSCLSACQPYELCVGSTCVAGRVAIDQPQENANVLVGAQVTVSARLTLEDGGVWPGQLVSIPVTTSWGASGSAVSGQPQPLDGGSNVGQGTLMVGWTNTPAYQMRTVNFVSCSMAACQPFEVCRPSVSGGTCETAPLTLVWDSPVASFVAGPRQPNFTMQVTVSSEDAGMLPATVPVTFAGGLVTMLMPMGAGVYRGDSSRDYGPEGTKTLVAGWPDGGRSSTRSFTWDTTGPVVTVVVEGRDAGDAEPTFEPYWKKDEKATMRVTVTGGRAAQVSDIVPPAGVTVASSTRCQGSCSGACQCFELTLAGAEIAGMRGTLPVQVGQIADPVGNLSQVADGGEVNVTRFKWARPIGLNDSSNALLPVAVSRSGDVIAAVANRPSTDPRVLAFAPDGGSLWGMVTTGTVTAGPMIGDGGVWVALNDANDTFLRSLRLSDGLEGNRECVTTTSNTFNGDMALGLTASTEVPLGIRNGEVQGPAMSGCRSHVLMPAPIDVGARPALVTQLSNGLLEAFVAYESDSRLWKASLSGTSWSGSGDTTLPAGTQPRGLFFDSTGRVGGGGFVGSGAFFMAPSAGTLTSGTSFISAPAANASTAVLGAGTLFFGTSGGALGRFEVSNVLADGGVATTGLGNLQGTTSALGRGGLLYVVSSTGTLAVLRQGDLVERWRASLGTSIAAVSQLALDVSRTPTGAPQCTTSPLGVLYVLTKTSSTINPTATLRAVLVDSNGLDPTAPWPKYQRDNGNTGNIDAPMTDWVCP